MGDGLGVGDGVVGVGEDGVIVAGGVDDGDSWALAVQPPKRRIAAMAEAVISFRVVGISDHLHQIGYGCALVEVA